MADTSAVRPLRLLKDLPIMVGGETFQISTVVLCLADNIRYPLLLGRPWLRATQIKQDWSNNRLTIRRNGHKICVNTIATLTPPQAITLVCGETVNMLDGMTEEDVDVYQEENPDFVPLFEIDILDILEQCVELSKSLVALTELDQASTNLERDLTLSQKVQATKLEELNLGT